MINAAARHLDPIPARLLATERHAAFRDRVRDGIRRFLDDHAMTGKTGARELYDFEKELHRRLMEAEREIVGRVMQTSDVEADAIEIEGRVHRRVLRSAQTYMTAAGEVTVERWLYKDRRDPTAHALAAMDLKLGIVEGFWTQRAAEQASWVVTQMVPQKAEELFVRVGNMDPSKSSLDRLPKALGDRWEQERQRYEQVLREAIVVPEGATTLAVSLDGVLAPIEGGASPTAVRAEAPARRARPRKGVAGASVRRRAMTIERASLPHWMILSLGLVASTAIAAHAWVGVRMHRDRAIDVTGSAKRRITSDLIEWQASLETRSLDRTAAYRALRDHVGKSLAYLKAQGVAEKELRVSSVATEELFDLEVQGKGEERLEKRVFKGFKTSQTILVRSVEVDKVERVSREVTQLMENGVPVVSAAPVYLYTKLGALKIEMLAEAAKDARTRAERMLGAAGGASLGRLRRADMGVININPANSTDVSSEGNNDTSSLDKDILTIVHCTFDLDG